MSSAFGSLWFSQFNIFCFFSASPLFFFFAQHLMWLGALKRHLNSQGADATQPTCITRRLKNLKMQTKGGLQGGAADRKETHNGGEWRSRLERLRLILVLTKGISVYPQILRQSRCATAAHFSPASGEEQRQRSHLQVLHRHIRRDGPKTQTQIRRQKTSGNRSWATIDGVRLSAHSPGLPSTTPASNLHTTPGSVAEVPLFLGPQNGIDLRFWCKSWKGSKRIW